MRKEQEIKDEIEGLVKIKPRIRKMTAFGDDNHAAIDAQIVAAVERELGALGMTRVASGPGDVVATYASFTRTDVNVKAKPLNGTARPEYSVGVLVVSLLDPESLQPLLKIRADKPVDAAGLDATISATVGEMFKRYPIRRRH